MEINGANSASTLTPSRLTSPDSIAQAANNVRRTQTTQTGSTLAASQDQSVPAQTETNQNTATQDELQSAVDKVQEFVSPKARGIEFSIDKESGTTVVKVVDRETDEIIRQIPSEEMLELAKALDQLQGILLKQKV